MCACACVDMGVLVCGCVADKLIIVAANVKIIFYLVK